MTTTPASSGTAPDNARSSAEWACNPADTGRLKSVGEIAQDVAELLAVLTSPNRAPWWAAVLLEKLDKVEIKQEKIMALQDDLAALLTSLQSDVTNLAAGQLADEATITNLQQQLATAQTALTTAQDTATSDDAQVAW
jgi:ribosomal protein L29